MVINKISLFNFRNYDNLCLNFNKSLNIIYGKNGSGKTNLVEAMYILSLTKSFRINNDKVLIKKGEKKLKVRGEIEKNEILSNYELELSDEGKTVYIDNEKIDKISNYISRINMILFNPNDIRLIDEAPEKRRKLINIEISQLHKEYLVLLADYNHLLRQRNFYLRGMYINHNYTTDYLDILTKKLIEYGLKINEYRRIFIENINKYIENYYESIFEKGKLKIRYVSTYSNKSLDDLLKMYKNNYQKEMENGKTLYGIHHDDFIFLVDNNNLKEYGSEGQRKNAIISFKLAEIDVVYENTNNYPILILDDLFSELDKGKVINILKLLNSNVQTFITSTDIKNISKKLLKNAKLFCVNEGIVTEENYE